MLVFFVCFVDDLDFHFEFGCAYFFVEDESAGGLIEELVGLEPSHARDDF